MKPTAAGPRHARFDNATTWPLPEPDLDDAETVAHALRYRLPDAVFTMADRFHAAEILDCYDQLIAMPLGQSRDVLRALKAAMALRGGRVEAGR